VTEWTKLVAIAVRTADCKAGNLPAVVQVPNMVPAGWGGTWAIASVSPSFANSLLRKPGITAMGSGPDQRSRDTLAAFGIFPAAPMMSLDPDAGGAAKPAEDIEARMAMEKRLAFAFDHGPELSRAIQRLERILFAMSCGVVGKTGLEALLERARFPRALADHVLAALGRHGVDLVRVDLIAGALVHALTALVSDPEEWLRASPGVSSAGPGEPPDVLQQSLAEGICAYLGDESG